MRVKVLGCSGASASIRDCDGNPVLHRHESAALDQIINGKRKSFREAIDDIHVRSRVKKERVDSREQESKKYQPRPVS